MEPVMVPHLIVPHLNVRKDVYLTLRMACHKILKEFESGQISKENAGARLRALERAAYKADPGAEEDGEITFCVADAWDKINGRD